MSRSRSHRSGHLSLRLAGLGILPLPCACLALACIDGVQHTSELDSAATDPADAAPTDTTLAGDETVVASGAGDRCADAQVISPGVHDDQTLAGYAADYGAGPDRAYAVTLRPGERLRVEFHRKVGLHMSALLFAVGSPESCEGLPGTTAGHAAEPSSGARWFLNTSDRDEVVFVVVANLDPSPDTPGSFRLTVTVDLPQAGDVCGSAVVLTPGAEPAIVTHQTFDGMQLDYADPDGLCGATGEPDRVYRVSVPPLTRLVASVLREASDLHLSIIDGPAAHCEASPLVCRATAGTDGEDEVSLAWSNPDPDHAADVFVVVSAAIDRHTTFGLRAAFESQPPGDGCGDAVPLTPGHHAGETTFGYGSDVASYLGCDPPSWYFADTSLDGWRDRIGDRVYRIDVPPGRRLDVVLTPETVMEPQPWVRLMPAADGLAGCRGTWETTACLAASQTSGGHPASVGWVNRSDQSVPVFVVVLGFDQLAANTFALDVAFADPAPHGDTCANADEVASGVYPHETTRDDVADFLAAPNESFPRCAPWGRDHVYAVEVPGGHSLVAEVTPEDQSDYLEFIAIQGPVSECERATRTCSHGTLGPAGSQHLRVSNRGVATTVVFLVVAASAPGGGGADYLLDIAVAPAIPGEFCENAEPLIASTIVHGSLADFANDYPRERTCMVPDMLPVAGPDRAYVLTLEANTATTWTFTALGDLSDETTLFQRLRIAVVGGDAGACEADACLGGGAAYVGWPASVTVVNGTGTAEAVYVLVATDAYGEASERVLPDFTIETQIASWESPDGDTCARAIPIESAHFSSGLVEADLAGSDVAFSDCGTIAGNDIAYRVVVPPATRLKVRLHAWMMATVAMIRGPAETCAAPGGACLAHEEAWPSEVIDGQLPFDVRDTEWTNEGTSPQEVFIVVGAAAPGARGFFAIVTDLVPAGPPSWPR